MILDRIENGALYYNVHKCFQSAFEYISKINIHTIAVGRHEIDGANMYALVQEYNTKLKDEGKWEAHRRYIDLQYVVQGAEGIGYANIQHLRQGEYDDAKDFLPLFGEGIQIDLNSGYFVLLFPRRCPYARPGDRRARTAQEDRVENSVVNKKAEPMALRF